MVKSVPVLSMQTLTFQPGTSRGASGVGWYNDKAGLVGNAAAKPQRMHSSLLFSFHTEPKHIVCVHLFLFYFSLSVIMNPATPPVITPFEMLLHAFFLAKVGKPSLQAKNSNFYARRGAHGLHLNELPCCFNTFPFPCRVFFFLTFPHLPGQGLLKQRCDSSSFSFFVFFRLLFLLLLPSLAPGVLLCQLIETVSINGSEPYRELRMQWATCGPEPYRELRMQSATPDWTRTRARENARQNVGQNARQNVRTFAR